MQASLAKQGLSLRESCRSILSSPILWLLAGYGLFLVPHAAGYLKHHPDERHYTDAGLRMVQTGDYLTPLTPEGELRLKKPILSYWLVAASYKLLGVSPFSSRLPFLLVGVGVVWVTYLMATYLYDNRQTGLLAALIVSCQPAILISSPRSVPDIVLSFYLLISAFGFLRLLRERRADWWSIALAYGGVGLAVEAKGLPAALFGCFAVAVLLAYQHQKVLENWQRHLSGFLLAASLGLAWFALMYGKHGDALFAQFFGDQVSERVNGNIWGVARDVPLVFLTVACCFLPWWGALVEGIKRRISDRDRISQLLGPTAMLLGGWSVCYLMMAACVDRVNVRYQSAIVPLLAVLAAGAMANLSEQQLKKWLTRLSRVAMPLLLIVSSLVALIAYATGQMLIPALFGVIAAFAGVIVLWLYLPRLHSQHLGLATVLTLLALFPVTYPAVRCIVGQSLEERLQAEITSLPSPEGSIAFFTKPAFASRLRVVSGGLLDGYWMGNDATAIGPEGSLRNVPKDVLVLSHRNLEQVDLSGFELRQVATNGFDKLPAKEVVAALWKGELAELLNSRRQYLTVAIPSAAEQLARESQDSAARR